MHHATSRALWYCKGCNIPHSAVELDPGASARCGRCGTQLFVTPRTGPRVGLAWSCCALIALAAAAGLPLLEVHKLNQSRAMGVFSLMDGFSRAGMEPWGIVTLLLMHALPLLTAAILILLNLHVLQHLHLPHAPTLMGALLRLKSWAMPEVFLLAVAVAFIKLDELAASQARSGLGMLIVGAIALLAALQRIERDDLPNRIQRHPPMLRMGSNRFCVAMLIAAALLLVPANLLPILEIRLPGQHQSQTLIGGVLSLLRHGMIGIALVVFIASIVVPLAKLIGLAWLLWSTRGSGGTRTHMKLHRVLNVIGRWSMLDVFLVAILSALIQFGSIAELRPGTATPAFAAAVLLTAIAVEHFDTRRLWPPEPNPCSIQSTP